MTDNGVPDLVVPRPQRFIVRRSGTGGDRPDQRPTASAIAPRERPTEIAVTLYRTDDIKLRRWLRTGSRARQPIPGYEGRLLVSGTPKPLQRLQTFPAGSLSIDTPSRWASWPSTCCNRRVRIPSGPGLFNSTLVAAEEPEEHVMSRWRARCWRKTRR